MVYGGGGKDELMNPMPQTQGGLGGLGGFFNKPETRDVIKAMGMSLMSSPRNAPLSGVGQYLPGIQDRRERREAGVASAAEKNRTLEYLRSNFPDIATQVDAGLPIPDAFRMAQQQRLQAAKGPDYTASQRDYLYAQENPGYAEFLQQGSGGQLGRTPIYLRDAEGNIVPGQMGNGEIVMPQIPEGYSAVPPADLAADKARSTARAKMEGESAAGAPVAIQMAADVNAQIQSLKNDPYLDRMVGPVDSRLPNVSGAANRVQAKIDQIQGGAFLQARQMLKGGGQITDYEGRRAESAYVRMNAAQSEADFKTALDDFNEAVQAGARRLAEQAGGNAAYPPSGGGSGGTGATSTGINWSVE